MAHIYEVSLDAKFVCIMDVIARNIGYGPHVIGLTAERRSSVHNMAEQAIINWAATRRAGGAKQCPNTNLQHLLDEYCALAEHL